MTARAITVRLSPRQARALWAAADRGIDELDDANDALDTLRDQARAAGVSVYP